jgi:hypothetical protein
VVARSKLRTRLLTAGVVGVVVAELVAEEADATAAEPPTRCLQMGWDSGVKSSLAMLSGSDVGGVVVETGEAETACHADGRALDLGGRHQCKKAGNVMAPGVLCA